MTLTFTFDPVITPAVRDGILDLWADVTDAGGAVGFVPPADRDAIRAALVKQLTQVADGTARLLVGQDAGGRVLATGFLASNGHRLMRHWVMAYTVMVHPDHQGKGYGRDLMAALADAARSLEGVEGIRLGCRGGLGLERFYASCGYKEVGRVPGAIRVAPGDDRDDVTMWLPLT
ncbi:GNAT family N-acetyltransferase [Streptomyces fragilis]|uniref:GNAT family N-acetyltransferase n=1 Tax=Streptomyces fragilis TaxID=67301 RepID=A0ABV2YLP0_9ACTN|nr:GNAT family N-acetyltransferase [Streptomyces fragilis]